MFNPSKPEPKLNKPTERANQLNDPQFEEQQGYFPYDLTHQEFLTTRFGEVTPTCNLHTIPGDRIVFKGNEKTVLTQINGNFLGTVNEYSDSFFVPLRSLFPINYEKLIPNPTKGDDLPLSAHPKFDLAGFFNAYFDESRDVTIFNDGDVETTLSVREFMLLDKFQDFGNEVFVDVPLTRWCALLYMFSRGQLLDYLGYSLSEELQDRIDTFFNQLYMYLIEDERPNARISLFYPENILDPGFREVADSRLFSTPSLYRDMLSWSFEHSYIINFANWLNVQQILELRSILGSIGNIFSYYLGSNVTQSFNYMINMVNSGNVSFNNQYHFINLSSVLAYQQVVAQYYTNNSVDNIFNADLYMQNLRAVMFPSDGNISSEPVFSYNGVETRYDLISYGATYFSLIANDSPDNFILRQYQFITLVFLLRNSLRYGDYFATARPNMLAVGDLSINVQDGAVSPIDITQNLLKQRYLNAANYIGSGFLPYMASIFGVTPSDTGTYPRFIAHYKQVLKSDITTNTANNQGAQTTNLLGLSDGNSYDCFIDDYGVILVLKSYDVLPVYSKGVDRTFGLTDRFDYFNPMLQNMGDQPILGSEIGGPYDYIFGYTMRNAEYKYKISRAHGAFVGSALRGFYLPFPADYYSRYSDNGLRISPDFIRDRPFFMDSLVPQMSGTSPGNYYHFVVSCINELKSARKMQATPPVLF